MPYKKHFLLLLIGLMALLLSACSENPDRLWVKAPGWSRALLIGHTRVGDQAPFVRDDAGNTYFLLIAGEDERYYPRVVAMAPDTTMLWDRSYEEVAIARPDKPGMVWDEGKLRLFWLSNQQLFSAVVEPANGLMPEWPQKLSGEHQVGDYSLARRGDGALILWYAGPLRNPGLYAFAPGDWSRPPTLVDDRAVRPQLAFDAEGRLHAIWAHMIKGEVSNDFFYAAYPQGEFVAPRL